NRCSAASSASGSRPAPCAGTAALASAQARVSASLNRSTARAAMPARRAAQASARAETETTRTGLPSSHMLARHLKCVAKIQIEGLVRLEHALEQVLLHRVLHVAHRQGADTHRLAGGGIQH